MKSPIQIFDHHGNNVTIEIDDNDVTYDSYSDKAKLIFKYKDLYLIASATPRAKREDYKFFIDSLDIKFNEITDTPKSRSLERMENEINLGVSQLQNLCHYRSYNAGWWKLKDGTEVKDCFEETQKYVCCTKIALIHSEISEALEGLRRNKQDDHLPHRKSVEVELADAIIRIADLAGFLNLDLAGAILEKMEYNAVRKDHTLEARAAEGGKVI